MRTFKINRPASDPTIRSSNFILLPTPPVLPIVASNPANNISQKTWVTAVRDGLPIYQKIIPTDGVFKAVEGTEISWNFVASDPSNKANQTIDATLTYLWRRDGSPITGLNSLNSFRGAKSVLITSQSCTAEVSGRYVCEVTNLFGTVETKPLDLLVFKLKDFPKLCTNLLVNGNADSNLDGWTTDSDIISRRFSNEASFLGSSFPGFTIDNWYRFKKEQWESEDAIGKVNDDDVFSFNQTDWSSTLPFVIQQWKDRAGPEWQTTVPNWVRSRWKGSGAENDSDGYLLSEWAQWTLFKERPQIVANEDRGDFSAFFPGMKWIDSYNKNEEVVGLYNESKDQILSYFTRDKIKFSKFGGVQTSQMTQTVDFSELADFVDGNVYGVSYLTSQFFSYSGAGITRYQIRVYRNAFEKAQVYNWYPTSPQKFFERLNENALDAKVAIPTDSVIEIVPIIDDVTEIQVKYFDGDGSLLTTDIIDGPTAQDVWAVKEKAYFPLTLYPLFEFFFAKRCTIKVFGQTYTTTSALEGLFLENTPYPQTTGVTDVEVEESGIASSPIIFTTQPPTANNPESIAVYIQSLRELNQTQLADRLYAVLVFGLNTGYERFAPLFNALPPLRVPRTIQLSDFSAATENTQKVTDRNALFMLQKFGFVKWDSLYPNFWMVNGITNPSDTTGIEPNRQNRAIVDRGAAAMFGVERTRIVPKFARSAQIAVKFTHQSEAFSDTDPVIKQWDSETLYLDVFGLDETNSIRFVEYGNPRCGLTKAKFVLLPNNFTTSRDYPTYKIPPSENTVLGEQKRLMFTDSVNTSINLDLGFTYIDVLPQNAAPITGSSPFVSQNALNNLNASLSSTRFTDTVAQRDQPVEEPDAHDEGEAGSSQGNSLLER